MDISIRWLIRVDMPEVLEIDRQSFSRTWDEERFISHLKQRNNIGMVARADRAIVGFMIYELCPKELTLHRIAVHPNHRREGVGRALIEKLTGKLSIDKRTRIETLVPEDSLSSQLFFRDMGFRATCIVEDLTEEDQEIVEYAMQYSLNPIIMAPANRVAQHFKELE